MLLGVRIKNFDIFDDDSCGILLQDFLEANSVSKEISGRKNPLQGLFPLKNLSAFIGKNGTGKTSFFEDLYFLKHSVTKNVADASITNKRPGFSNLVMDKQNPSVFEVFFKLKDQKTPLYISYELSVAATVHGSPYVFSEKAYLCNKREDSSYEKVMILEFKEGVGKVVRDIGTEAEEGELSSKHQTVLKSYGGIKAYKLVNLIYKEIDGWFFCKFSSEEKNTYFEDGNAPGGHKHLDSTGSNVNNVLEYLRVDDIERYNEIMSFIETKSIALKRRKNLPAKLDSSPDKFLLYLLLLNEKTLHSTIFIETPDRDLYFDMVDALAEEFRDYSVNHAYNQIIFTTHNSRIVEAMPPHEIWMFKRADDESEEISIISAGKDPLVEAMFDEGIGMGSIWYSGHLDD